jgi:hypothetical protein
LVGAGSPESSLRSPDICKPAPTNHPHPSPLRAGLPASSQHCPDIGEPAPTNHPHPSPLRAGLPASSQHCPDIGEPAPTNHPYPSPLRAGLPASSQHCPDIGEPAPTNHPHPSPLRAGLPESSQHCPDIGEPAPTKRHGLPEIVRGFKTSSARRINQLRSVKNVPLWQRGYYEHIIRHEFSLRKIREYIINNPTNWMQDQLHPENIFPFSKIIDLNLDAQIKLPINLKE